jgi:methylthioribose-1-phosphate isomerase
MSVATAEIADPRLPRMGRLPLTLEWSGGLGGHLRLLDQTRLPGQECYVECDDVQSVWEAIRALRVRGAPAIGVAAAYGMYVGMREFRALDPAAFAAKLDEVAAFLCGARPTAVNLAWAVRRVRASASAALAGGTERAVAALLGEAHAIALEDAAVCRRIGEAGAELIEDGMGVLTHCNAGALATVAYGTALAAMYVAHERGRRFHVFADETRPLLQGARLTAYELSAVGIDVTIVCDGAAASLMQAGRIQLVIVGADRIAANGDTANKIGTYGVAIAAARHAIPFYVAAPRSTFDLSLADGGGIPIEERDAVEVRTVGGQVIAAGGARCANPAFDVTPAELIRGIITERGIVSPVNRDAIRQLFG